jgi:predicted DNA-binding transcriptional regulator AlpA
MGKPQLVATPAAAEHLGGLKPTTLEIWRVNGTGPKFIKCGRLVRYRIEDLDAYLEARTCNSTSQVVA